ncbi:MAG: glutathione S-transferase [Chitinophagales bacterium]|jgi:glutathione S-transferase
MATDTITLHQYQASPFCAKIRRVLYYKFLTFEVVNYALLDISKVRKLSPIGKLPVLEHKGVFIADSSKITAYLDELTPDKPLLPADPMQQAHAHIIEDWADESLYFYDVTMRCWDNNISLLEDDLLIENPGLFGRLIRPIVGKALRKTTATQGIGRKSKKQVLEDVESHFNALENLLQSSRWLVGNELSIADISVASMCTVMARAQEGRALMERFTRLSQWRSRVDELTVPSGVLPENVALS